MAADPCCRSFEAFLDDWIRKSGARTVCDVGGGANPLLEVKYLRQHQLRCSLLDLSEEELAKAPPGYPRVVADVSANKFSYDGEKFDLVFSRMVAEHVRSGERFHRNILQLLAPGGLALHCFPTLYSLPFVVNRLTPAAAASRLLDWVSPRDRYRYGKFPAYYSWCRGPLSGQILRLRELGYDVLEYRGLFGHPYYGERGPITWVHRRITAYLLRHPVPALTSFAFVALQGNRDAVDAVGAVSSTSVPRYARA